MPKGPGLVERLMALSEHPELRARYVLKKAIGTGGMAVVFEAVQVATGRRVALKFMLNLEDEHAIARLQREGKVLARVAHPGLTRVLDAAAVEGHPYLVTELMEGGTVMQRIEERGRLKLEDALAVTRDVLGALQACHDAGVVHRDVKPSNILYDGSGRARLADLGVAHWNDANTILTEAGAVIGTPLYVAPEMIGGAPASVASDLYALGVTLHYMLAGKPPFDSDHVPHLLRMQVKMEPPRLDELVGDVPAGIVDFTRRLLAKQPAERPATAAVALQELESALSGRAPAAGRARPTNMNRALRAQRRRLTGAAGVALVLGGAIAWVIKPAPPPPASPVRVLVVSSATPRPPEPARARPATLVALPDAGAPVPPAALGHFGRFWPLHPHMRHLGATLDGARIATASGNCARAWDARARRMVGSWRSRASFIAGVAPIEGTDAVAVACRDRSPLRVRGALATPPPDTTPVDVYVWETGGKDSRNVEGPAYASVFAFAPGGKFVAWHDAAQERVEVVDLVYGTKLFEAAAPRPRAVALARSGTRVALLYDDHVSVRDAGGASRRIPRAPGGEVFALSPDGRRLAVSGARTLEVLAAENGARVASAEMTARGLAFSPGGDRLAVEGDGGIAILDAATLARAGGEPGAGPLAFVDAGLVRSAGHAFALPGEPLAPEVRRTVALDAGARFAVLAEPGGALAAWDRRTGRETPLSGPGATVAGVALDGETVHLRRASAAPDVETVTPVEVATGRAGRELAVRRDATYVALGRGRRLVVHADLTVDLVDAEGAVRALVSARSTRPVALREAVLGIDRNERWLALVHPERGLVAMDLRADALRGIWSPSSVKLLGIPREVEFLEPARQAVLATADGLLHVVGMGSGSASFMLTGPLNAVLAMASSADGKTLVGGHADGSMVLWDVAQRRMRTLAGPGGLEVRAVGLDVADGLALSLDDAGVVTAWDLR